MIKKPVPFLRVLGSATTMDTAFGPHFPPLFLFGYFVLLGGGGGGGLLQIKRSAYHFRSLLVVQLHFWASRVPAWFFLAKVLLLYILYLIYRRSRLIHSQKHP